MWNLQKETAFCLEQLRVLNIPYGNIVSIVPRYEKKIRWWGYCTNLKDGGYQIEIHGRLLSEDIPLKVLRQTIMHEILHTCPGCLNHGPIWKRYGRQVSEAYGYTITRLATAEEQEYLDKTQRIPVPELMPKEKGITLDVGNYVHHRQFGDGVIVGIIKMGTDAILEISFQDGTSRRLMQKLASTKMRLLTEEEAL